MYANNNTENTVMQDIKNGKEVPWRVKKVRTLKLADSYKRLGYENKSLRIKYCGTTLIFLENLKTGEKHLHKSNFCRERLCPMCAWRKSLKCFWQISNVMDKIQEENSEIVPLFLTLTVKNCKGDNLSSCLDNIFSGWHRLNSRTKMKRIIKGWFRALEVTYNEKDDTFHPHIHAIFLVDKSYFKSKDYLKTKDWVQIWRQSLNLDYDPVCDIRKIKSANRKAVAEVAKYTVKDVDYISDDKEKTDKLVSVLDNSLKGRRLISYGGIMKKTFKELGMEDLEKSDLVHIDGNELRGDIAYAVTTYCWRFGVANYHLKYSDKIKPE